MGWKMFSNGRIKFYNLYFRKFKIIVGNGKVFNLVYITHTINSCQQKFYLCSIKKGAMNFPIKTTTNIIHKK